MNVRSLLVVLVAVVLVAGCMTTTTTTTKGRPLPIPERPDVEPGDAIIYGRFFFRLDGYMNRTGEIRKNLKVCITEYWPPPGEKDADHWVTTDRTGYYELAGVDPAHGYNVTEVVFPEGEEGEQTSEVNMGFRLRPDHRVLSLGELVCIIRADGGTNYPLTDLNVYDPRQPLNKYALEKHSGGKWGELIRNRYVIARSTGGF